MTQVLMTLTLASFCSSVPVSHASVTVSQHAQYQDRNWSSWMEFSHHNSIIYTCAFPSVTSQNGFSEKGPLPLQQLQTVSEQCGWWERVRWTEGVFVLPTSYESWFWLVEVPAHISSLWCEDDPGTDPPPSSNSHLPDAARAMPSWVPASFRVWMSSTAKPARPELEMWEEGGKVAHMCASTELILYTK